MLNTSNMPFTMNVEPTGSGFGNGFGDGAWWIIILLIFAWGGFGGYGNAGMAAVAGASDNYVLASDFATLQRQIDSSTDRLATQSNGIANGLCDGFYTQAQLVNGVNQNIANSTASITQAITTSGYENQLGQQNISQQISNCCCNMGTQISDLNYNLATQSNGITNAITNGFCQTNYNASTNTRDIVDSQNAGTQAILARLEAMESSRKDEKIAELQAQNSDLRLSASQATQNAYLVEQLRPSPIPSYTVANPYCCNSSCGCM